MAQFVGRKIKFQEGNPLSEGSDAFIVRICIEENDATKIALFQHLDDPRDIKEVSYYAIWLAEVLKQAVV